MTGRQSGWTRWNWNFRPRWFRHCSPVSAGRNPRGCRARRPTGRFSPNRRRPSMCVPPAPPSRKTVPNPTAPARHSIVTYSWCALDDDFARAALASSLSPDNAALLRPLPYGEEIIAAIESSATAEALSARLRPEWVATSASPAISTVVPSRSGGCTPPEATRWCRFRWWRNRPKRRSPLRAASPRSSG